MRTIAAVMAAVALCAACGNGATEESRDLETLRGQTESYKDTTVARLAGWTAMLTPCMTAPDSSGAMGIHYGNPDLIGDGGQLDVAKPEVLIFEPTPAGRVLVAVEYVVPYAAHSRDSAPPVLFGQDFQQFDDFQLWGLHVWAWRDNPKGLFAPWNPDVSCDPTAGFSTMAMH